jgi:hypothetical protein
MEISRLRNMFMGKLSMTIQKAEWEQPGNLNYGIEATYKPDTCTRGQIQFTRSDSLHKNPANQNDSVGCRNVLLVTKWSNDVQSKNFQVDAVLKFRTTDGTTSIVKKNGQGGKIMMFEKNVYNKDNQERLAIHNMNTFSVTPENLYDESGSFIVEVEVLVEIQDQIKNKATFLEDISSILDDEESSDFLIVSDNKEFKCHKNILKARSKVFKNMLVKDHAFQESSSNSLILKDVSDEAVEEMLNHVYSGKIPDDQTVLTDDLLKLADMYQLDSLKDACIGNMIDGLEVENCISVYIMIDRLLPEEAEERKIVKLFMVCKILKVVETDNWNKLATTFPNLVTELIKAMAARNMESCKHVCQFCVIGKCKKWKE